MSLKVSEILRNRRAMVALGIGVLVMASGAYLFYVSYGAPAPSFAPSRLTVGGKTFAIAYVAANQSAWVSGLMNKKITNTTIMLFVFPKPAIYSFWMYDTNTSLDIIWLSETGAVGDVVYVVAGAPSCYVSADCTTYTPPSAANLVIEARAGFAQANGITVGTVIRFG
ncbi:MAG: DUF192 domain-containing protein [Nitrososphaerota archaeon]|nr:DUF192 domain-containing protein [Nitrososphaerota archaeon]